MFFTNRKVFCFSSLFEVFEYMVLSGAGAHRKFLREKL